MSQTAESKWCCDECRRKWEAELLETIATLKTGFETAHELWVQARDRVIQLEGAFASEKRAVKARDETIATLTADRDALRTALEETPPLSVWVGCQYGLQPDVDAITDWMRLKIEALGGKS